MKYVWLITLLFITSISAEVYKWTDVHGNIIYSDKPHHDAEVIDVLTAPSYTPPVIPYYPKAVELKKAKTYEVSIVTPHTNEGLWSNDGVPVTVKVTPPLSSAAEQKLLVTIDGQLMEQAQASTSFTVPIFERGTHTISVDLQSKAGIILATSEAISFRLHRPRVNNNQP